MNIENLLKLARVFAAHRGLQMSTVSTYASGDGKVFRSWERGATCTVRRAARIATWFSENWPLGLDWPSDIPRPKAPRGKAAAQDAA